MTTTVIYPSLDTLQIILNPTQTQQAQFVQGQAFPSIAIQTQFDRQVQMIQRLQDEISRALHAPDGDVNPVMTLPPASVRALTFPTWDVNGNYASAQTLPSGTLSAASIGSFTGPPTFAELACGVTVVAPWLPVGNMLRYGLVPNSSAAATLNTGILRQLFNPSFAGPIGAFNFPNTTGADTYYINGVVLIRQSQGILIEGNGCTINYTSTCLSTDTNSGGLFLLSDVTVQNLTMNVACDTTATTGCGHGIFIGARGTDAPTVTYYDSLAARSLGRIVLRNVNINVNNTGPNVASSGAIEMLGGIRDTKLENVVINLNGSCAYGIIYEFGWATNEASTSARQTSHAHDLRFTNINVINVGAQDGGTGSAIWLGAAYNTIVENLYVNNAPVAFTYTSGESLNYRPWVGVDDQGVKRNTTLRNIVGEAISGTFLSLSGATPATGYLSAVIAALGHPFDYQAQTDLMAFSVDGFSGNAAGFGIDVNGDCDIRNGLLNGASASGQLVIGVECQRGQFTNVKVLNSTSTGIRTDFGPAIWSPTRLRQLTFDNCLIAGNAVNGTIVTNTETCIFRNCRFGYNTLFDVLNETTQTNCVNVSGSGNGGGVICDGCVMTPVTGSGGFSYVTSGTPSGSCDIRNPQGTVSISGNWDIDGVGQSSSTSIGTATAYPNQVGKFAGRRQNDTSNHRLMIAQGPNPTDPWWRADGAVSVTPV
jgi:hypothetical protein